MEEKMNEGPNNKTFVKTSTLMVQKALNGVFYPRAFLDLNNFFHYNEGSLTCVGHLDVAI